MKPLVIYYSYRGNTKSIVDMIQKKIDADVLRIETVVPYSTNYNQVVNQRKEKLSTHSLQTAAGLGTHLKTSRASAREQM